MAEMVDAEQMDVDPEAEYRRGRLVGRDGGMLDALQGRKHDGTLPDGFDDGYGENVVGLSMGWCHGYDAGYTEGLEIGLRARIGIDEDGDVIDEDE